MPSSPSPANDGGFTLLETMTGLLALAIALGAIWILASAAGRSFGTSGAAGGRAAEAALVDRSLRSACARVRPPFWVPPPSLPPDSSSLALPYLDGERDRSMEIDFAAGKLRIGSGGEASVFGGLSAFSASPIGGGAGSGIEFSFGIGERKYSTRALFGSFHLVEGRQ